MTELSAVWSRLQGPTRRMKYVGVLVALATAASGIGVAGAAGTTGSNPTPSSFVPITPVRVLDTRTGTGGISEPLEKGQVANVTIAGTNGIPATATGLVVNVTEVDGTSSGYLTVFPTGDPQPATSTLNWTDSEAHPNTTSVGVGTAGQISFFNKTGEVDVIADVVGYYTALPAPTPPTTAFVTGGAVTGSITNTAYAFIAPATAVTLTAGETVTGTAVAALGVKTGEKATTIETDICYQDAAGNIYGINGGNLLITFVSPGTRLPYTATAAISNLAAGTYSFGFCARIVQDGNGTAVDNNDYSQGSFTVLPAAPGAASSNAVSSNAQKQASSRA